MTEKLEICEKANRYAKSHSDCLAAVKALGEGWSTIQGYFDVIDRLTFDPREPDSGLQLVIDNAIGANEEFQEKFDTLKEAVEALKPSEESSELLRKAEFVNGLLDHMGTKEKAAARFREEKEAARQREEKEAARQPDQQQADVA